MRALTTESSPWVFAAAVALALVACSTDDEDPAKDAGGDSGVTDAVVKPDGDPVKPDGTVEPDGAVGPDGSGPSEIENPFGFAMRVPQERTLPCPDAPEYLPPELQQLDMDWLCTFDHEGVKGQVYLQATPVGCKSAGMSMAPELEVKGAFIATDGKLSPLADAYYDWGGNHHNDELGFSHGGKHYRYYHSSFGFGWRQCQPMDCMQVLAAPGGALLADGCTAERTLPVICLQVDGSKTSYGAADLASDPFAKCPGDSNP